jgi:type VI secretion system protein ImpG
MDPRLVNYYNQELQHLREMGAEFAQEFPKIAARLGMDGVTVADPYVERLLEGVGFLAARVQLKLDAEFPRFTQRLLEIVYPNYLAPTPAMLIAQFRPELSGSNLARGVTIPRATALHALQGKGDVTACQFRTAHDVTLWPVELVAAQYFSFAPDLPLSSLAVAPKVKGGICLRLRTTAGLAFNQLALDRLRLHFSGNSEVAHKLHELCMGAPLAVLVAPGIRPWPGFDLLPPSALEPVGYSDEQALLPVTLRTFQGYRLLEEYFAFPQRFLFADIAGLAPALARITGSELELVILFSRGEAGLEERVDAGNFELYCSPAINLFAKRADRIHLSDAVHEHHVVPNGTRPLDFEIYEVNGVTGYGVGHDSEQIFLPLYAAYHTENAEHQAYFTLRREPRLLSTTQKRNGFRSSYVGSEAFIALVDPSEAPYRSGLRQLAVTALCTNRDLPLQMPLGIGKTDFSLEMAAPIVGVRALSGPSKPYSPLADRAMAWQLVSQLSLNYLSLVDANEREGAAALRQILELYARTTDGGMKKQIEGLLSVRSRPLVRRLPIPGFLTFGRGLQIELEVDELAFQGASAFLFGCVMEQFLARYASLNSFTETVLRSSARGEIMRWRPRCGERPII